MHLEDRKLVGQACIQKTGSWPGIYIHSNYNNSVVVNNSEHVIMLCIYIGFIHRQLLFFLTARQCWQ